MPSCVSVLGVRALRFHSRRRNRQRVIVLQSLLHRAFGEPELPFDREAHVNTLLPFAKGEVAPLAYVSSHVAVEDAGSRVILSRIEAAVGLGISVLRYGYAVMALRLLTVDLHTPAIEGFFDIPVDHMRMAFLMASHYRSRIDWQEAVVVSPDAGGVARATEFRDNLKSGLDQVIARDELAIAFKRRTPKGRPSVIDMVGDVRGRPAVIYDDIVQSGGTLLQVVDRLLERGATEVHAAVVHADFTPGTLDNLRASSLKSLALTDSTAAALDVEQEDGIEIVTTARILAQAMWRIHAQQSVGWIFNTLRAHSSLPPVERDDSRG